MCCVMLRCVVLLYWCCVVAVLCYAVVCCAVVWCGVVWCGAVLCSTLRCAALCCAAVLRCAQLCCADLCCAMLCWAALRLLPPSSFPPSSSPSSFNFQCMHCSAAVWYFSLLTAAALGASASAVLVVPCWKFWSLAVACFNDFQNFARFPFTYQDRFFLRVGFPC